MKYAVIRCTDGNYDVHSEHPNIEAAKIAFHSYCASLWNDKNTKMATVKIVDENLDNAEGYRDFIYHEQEQTNEPE